MGGTPPQQGFGGAYGAPPQPQGQPGQPDYGQQQQPPPGAYDPNAQPGGGFGGAMNPMNPMGQPYPGAQGMMGPMGGPGMMAAPGAKSWMTTLLLAVFLGWAGVHRFYTGHTLFGVLQLITCGGSGIWQVIDIIFILTGRYTDAQGRPLVKS
jgi:TM2 domain-containing membrane protein YozV